MFIQQDLYDALRHDTCPICHLLAKDVSKYVDSIFYEFVNTPETHFAMRASRGLCARHGARALEGMGNALGIAVLYKGILNEMVAVTERPDSAAARLFTRKDIESALRQVPPAQSAPSKNAPNGIISRHLPRLVMMANFWRPISVRVGCVCRICVPCSSSPMLRSLPNSWRPIACCGFACGIS